MELADTVLKINELKEDKNAVILAHNYQLPEIQDIADMLGDSFALSQAAQKTEKDVIVFCGVHFMAESAKILSPEKTVLLPAADAGCPMADMVTPEDLIKMKERHPKAAVVCYINTSAEVKALSDICCTSSNAVKVVKSVKNDEIIFIPDKNLGSYVARHVPEKKIILWEGYCITHKRVSAAEVIKAKEAHPDAKVLVHPEISPDIWQYADFIGSTKEILEYAKGSDGKKFIIGTEMGIIHKLKKDNPDKIFYLLSSGLVCANMKKTRINDVLKSLELMQYKVEVPEKIRIKALASLKNMLAI